MSARHNGAPLDIGPEYQSAPFVVELVHQTVLDVKLILFLIGPVPFALKAAHGQVEELGPRFQLFRAESANPFQEGFLVGPGFA